MCGFSGAVSFPVHDGGLAGFDRNQFLQMAQRLKHRGDTETRLESTPCTWLCHHRLAFQDIRHGQQPMRSACQRFTIVFNGEIYNHLALRRSIPELSDYPFQTQSDTETLVAAYSRVGNRFFEDLDGEYAFVILAQDARHIVAHRCPAGVKPLFFASPDWNTADFSLYQESYSFRLSRYAFASEIKGLAISHAWDREGLLRQYTGLYEPVRTPYSQVIQVPPGGTLILTREDDTQSADIPKGPIRWKGNLHLRTDSLRSLHLRGHVAPEAFAQSLRESVADRLLSDVPLGVYLSGGIDSRAVASLLASEQSSKFARMSFTVGFQQHGYDETQEALDFARTLGFRAHVLHLSQEMLNYSYPLAVQASENIQPYTNGAAKWWLSRMTRRHVQGVLTGDGADELLCGYPSYRYAKWWAHVMRARENHLSNLEKLPLGSLPRDGLYAQVFAEQTRNPWLAGSSAAGTGLDFVDSAATWGVFHPLFDQIQSIATLLLGKEALPWLEAQGSSLRSWFAGAQKNLPGPDALLDPRLAVRNWQNYFFRTHLPVQVLNWVGDRMEMANVLEGRTPFLSRKLRQLVFEMSDHQLINGFQDKFILRQSMRSIMPAHFTRQPKKQFGAPFLNTPQLLRQYQAAEAFAESGLDPQKLDFLVNRLELLEKNGKESHTGNKHDPHAVFDTVNLNQYLQTAVSLAINHKSLVKNEPILRDLSSEESVLVAQESVSSP